MYPLRLQVFPPPRLQVYLSPTLQVFPLPGCSSSFLTAVLRAENVCQTLPVLSLKMHIILCLTQIETQNKHRDKEKTQRQTHHKNK